MLKYDDRRLFEDLVLDGAQAGLNWLTILRKRENYQEAFDGVDLAKVAAYDEAKIEELLGDAGIIRNRQKINSAIRCHITKYTAAVTRVTFSLNS